MAVFGFLGARGRASPLSLSLHHHPLPPLPIHFPSACSLPPMSTIFNFNLLDGTTAGAVSAAVILTAIGAGTFAVVRHNRRRAQQADPEAIALEVTHAVVQGVAPGSAGNAGASEQTGAVGNTGAVNNTGAVDNTGPVEAYGVVEGGVTVGAIDSATVGSMDITDAMGVCGAIEGGVTIEGGVALGVDQTA